MNCICCKEVSDNSKSVEHIIPESLGNKSHTLNKGIVCDKCNNYFALKIEKEVLELPYFKSLRHRNYILNKKNERTTENGYSLHPNGGQIDIIQQIGSILEVRISDKEILNVIKCGTVNTHFIPILSLPPNNNLFVSRLLGEIALEALAERIQQVKNWNQDFMDHTGLDDLRNYVRYGIGKFWEYNVRKIYDGIKTFEKNLDALCDKKIQILHGMIFSILIIISTYTLFAL